MDFFFSMYIFNPYNGDSYDRFQSFINIGKPLRRT